MKTKIYIFPIKHRMKINKLKLDYTSRMLIYHSFIGLNA